MGQFGKFGSESITKLRFAKKQRYMSIEIQIPEIVWQNKTLRELQFYLTSKIEIALSLCIQRLDKDKISIDKKIFFKQVKMGISEFLQNDYSKNPLNKNLQKKSE
jgi:hypothetical protein